MSRGEAPGRTGAGDLNDADDATGSTFMRGLAIGTLIGAAIAGSAIWEQLRGRAAREADRAGGARAAPVLPGSSRPNDPDQTT
jgi:hypothetical protein